MKRPGTIQKILAAPFIGLIYIYRYVLSPLLPRGCRHYPSCSVYSIEALRLFGPYRGGLLAANRILRCQPWGTSGYDPVPKILVKKSKYGMAGFGTRLKYPAANRLKNH